MEQEDHEPLDVDGIEGYVLIANEILRKCKINGQVESLVQCSDSFFVAVYEGIFGEPLQGVTPDAVSRDDKIVNCSIVIDALSCDVLNVDLSHITGEDIVEGDITSVQNLLEIFKELLDFILDVDEMPILYHEDEQNDSNLLSSDHEVISDVLKEEFGSSYESLSTQRKLPRNENLGKPNKLLSSHGSIIDTDISMIPKWSRSLGSSRSSDSNSTGEIIRESELLERQLAREYPSLHKLREENGLETSHDRLDEAQEAEARAVTAVVKKTSLDTRQAIKPSTTNRSSPVKDAERSHIKDVGLQTEDIKEKQYNMIAGVENQVSRNRRVRESQGGFKDSRTLNDKRILDDGAETSEQLSAIGDTRGPRIHQNSVGHSKLFNDDRISNSNVGEPDRIRNCRTLQVETEMGLQAAVTRPDVRLKDKTMKNGHDEEKKLQLQSDTTTLGERNGGKPKDKRRALEQLRISEKSTAPRLNYDFVAKGNSEVAEESGKSKLRSKALGGSRVEEEQRGSRLRSRDDKGVYKDNNEHDGSDTSGILWDDQISPLDASEELQKLGTGTGLAFEEIGLKRMGRQKKEMNKRVEESQDKNFHQSPIFHHYHHHFHHPNGSSEDLQRDAEYTARAAASEDQRHRTGRKNIGKRSLGERKGRSSRKDDIPGKRCVKFNDNVDMLLITSRMERLKREMEKDEKEQEDRRHVIKSSYGEHLNSLNKEHKKMEKELKQRPKVITKPSPRRTKRSVPRVSRDRAQAVYSKATNCKKARFPSSKARKRSTSASPKVHQKKKTTKQLEKGDILLPTMLHEFPFLHLSPHTLQTMRKKQTQQLLALSKSASESGQTKTQKVLEDAEKRQQTLLKILRKDLLHNQRMREQKERKEQERAIKSTLRDKRQASARARRYYEDYQLRMRARLLKRRTREEQIFKNLFQDGLEIQKQRVQELRTYAKEQREVRAVRQQNELESLENYYRDQYSILAEAIAHEKETLQVREKAQEKVIQEMQRNLRLKLQKEVVDIQETLVRDEDDAYFRRLDAERLRRQMQMTAFQNLS